MTATTGAWRNSLHNLTGSRRFAQELGTKPIADGPGCLDETQCMVVTGHWVTIRSA